jgi:hypothetical protein
MTPKRSPRVRGAREGAAATARRIMRKMKGWRAKDEREDLRDHPVEHTHELQWLVRELQKFARARAEKYQGGENG